MDIYIIRGKMIILMAVSLFLLAIGLELFDFDSIDFNDLTFEYINIKDIATASSSIKSNKNTILNSIFDNNPINKGALEELVFQPIKEEKKTISNADIWHLPTQVGQITQYPSYYHAAFDITSYRGTMENIYPVANGVISGIYKDNAGALIVTISHNINGVNYTSQYVHLSSYAQGLYVGRPVTINDAIGRMGMTGIATGVHLHLAVVDCKLFDSNDPYCKDLNGFFNYAKRRYNEGFNGLGSLINVPYSW